MSDFPAVSLEPLLRGAERLSVCLAVVSRHGANPA
jgi:hypothetical protein